VTSDPFPPATAVTLTIPENLFVTVTGTLITNFAVPAASPWMLALLGAALLVIGLKFGTR
jgi:hypothetical protein